MTSSLERATVCLWAALAVIIIGALAGCSGTQATFDGTICGQPVKMTINDRRDRESFIVTAECPDGGGVTIASGGSVTSGVAATDAEFIGRAIGAGLKSVP